MASRRSNLDSDEQLDLFTAQRPTHDTVDAIRPNGRETLARALPGDGARTGAEGPAPSDAPGSGGEDQGRAGELANRTHEAGQDGSTSARPGLGDGSREIHPAPPGELNGPVRSDRKSTRLNSSHPSISYAVFCLKKKKKKKNLLFVIKKKYERI